MALKASRFSPRMNKIEENNSKMDADLPAVQWQLDRLKWSQQNRYLLEKQIWTDCVFVVGEKSSETKRFECHKLLLGKVSAVFAAMLFGELANEDEDIAIIDIEPDTFQVLLEFIYTESVDFKKCGYLIPELCQAANKYMVQPLEALCFDHLTDNLKPETVCRAYDLAKLLGCSKLKQLSRKMIERRTDEVLAAESFSEASQDVLLFISEQEELHLPSEAQLITACFDWAEFEVQQEGLTNDTAGLREVLGPVLKNLRFLTLTQAEFLDGPANTKPHLTAEEKLKLLTKIISPQTECEIPKGFSDISKTRIFLEIPIPNFVFSEVMSNAASKLCMSSTCITVDCEISMQGVVVPSSGTNPWNVVVQDSLNNFYETGVLTTAVDSTRIGSETRVEFAKHVLLPRNEKCRVIVTSVQTEVCRGAAGVALQGKNVFSDQCIAPNVNSETHIRGIIYVKV